MARARNIKPSFFLNDELAEIQPLGRLLFIGMWTIADYKGDFAWYPKRLKVQLLPYDNCDINKLAINLDKSGFIRFYSDGDEMYVNIVNFTKHQNPHKNEKDKGSEIPMYSEEMRQLVDLKRLTINRDLSGAEPECSTSDPADSLNLIPDSLNLIPDIPKKPQRFRKPTIEEINDYCKQRNNRVDAQKFFDFYESKGWKVGNSSMKDWKASVRTWESNSSNSRPANQHNPSQVTDWGTMDDL